MLVDIMWVVGSALIVGYYIAESDKKYRAPLWAMFWMVGFSMFALHLMFG